MTNKNWVQMNQKNSYTEKIYIYNSNYIRVCERTVGEIYPGAESVKFSIGARTTGGQASFVPDGTLFTFRES